MCMNSEKLKNFKIWEKVKKWKLWEELKSWKKWELLAVGLLGVVMIAAIVALGSIFMEYTKGSSAYKELEAYVFLPEEQAGEPSGGEKDQGTGASQAGQEDAAGSSESVKPASESIVHYGQSPQVDFGALSAKNSDVVGWIYGPDTVINYPVVHGTDNEFYLTHMFDGEKNKCGSIFMDCLNAGDFSNENTILHGHHMKNGTMFASLMKYADQDYYDTHPVMWLVTTEKTYLMEIFTGFVTTTDSDVWQIGFASREEYGAWLDKMAGNSAFESGVTPQTSDRILTLSTCSYEYDDARFVVMGILRERIN